MTADHYRATLDAARERIAGLLAGVPRALSIDDLSRLAWCSRGTATACVRQLESEGLAVVEPGRGWRAPETTSVEEDLLRRVLGAMVDSYGAASVSEIAAAAGVDRHRARAALLAAEGAGGAARVVNGLAPMGWVLTDAGRTAVARGAGATPSGIDRGASDTPARSA